MREGVEKFTAPQKALLALIAAQRTAAARPTEPGAAT
jgi:hypothetical protein